MDDTRVVPVQIQGLEYPIRSNLDADYIASLAAYVDGKIRAAIDTAPSGDALRVAVIAALNIADELFRCRETIHAREGAIVERAGALERMLDRVLLA
jgi:cell division protein ZapA